MAGNPCIQCRVAPETKARFRALAERCHLNESALLKRLIDLALLQAPNANEARIIEPPDLVSRDARVYVRLSPDDHLLLRERAVARGTAAATYVSMLVRSHLRALTPIPERELAGLERATAALGAVGRNLNQLARVANQTGRASVPGSQDLYAVLRACSALRDHLKEFIRVNRMSWERGCDETHG